MNRNRGRISDIIKIPFRYAPQYAFLIGIQKVLEGVVPTIQVIVTARFLDTALAIVSNSKNYSDIFVPLSLVILLIAYSWTASQLSKFVDVKLEMKLRESFRTDITKKRAKLKYSLIENNHTWDLICRVAKEPIRFHDLMHTNATLLLE